MKRDIISRLHSWSKNERKVPLILRGARQVGKSWLVREFAKSFPSYLELNFEKTPSIKQAFAGDIDVKDLLARLSVYSNVAIEPGKTLLFIDEIQECPAAITYLRYFKEECPELHVLAAGSLIEFVLEEIGMPVGRVDYLHVGPLSFGEFLEANNRKDLRELSLNKEQDPLLDNLLKDYLRIYLWLGGMPEVVDHWLSEKNAMLCQEVQKRIIASYQDDFAKYAKKNQIQYVDKVFNNIPKQFAQKFVYTQVDSEVRARPLKEALQLLEKAGIAHLCYYTAAQSMPLSAMSNEKFFKTFFLDVGLAQNILGLDQQDWLLHPIKVDNIGGVAEQFVAQELISYQSNQVREKLFYWQRQAKNASAEVDFILSVKNQLIPVEVKAGKTGRMKSLHTYLNSHAQAAYGLKISEQAYAKHEDVLQIPLYAIEAWLKEA